MKTSEEYWQEFIIPFGESRHEPEAGQEDSSQTKTE